jgi:hypothetical protein
MWWVLASSGPLDGVAHSMGDYVKPRLFDFNSMKHRRASLDLVIKLLTA